MNGPGKKFLSSPTLSIEEYRAVSGGNLPNLVEYPKDLWVFTHNVVEAKPTEEFLSEGKIFIHKAFFP